MKGSSEKPTGNCCQMFTRNLFKKLFQQSNLLKNNHSLVMMSGTSGEVGIKEGINLDGFDAFQIKLLSEMVIVVDKNDNQIGVDSKKNCHLVKNINSGLLHRAFSVFLFNSKNELLVQKRSPAKITFPEHFANTCCSHPLNNNEEVDCSDNFGVKKAALRRLQVELGISELTLEDLTHITRVHYKANSDDVWGEHEIDHVLFAKKDVNVKINPNEVSEIRYFNPEDLKIFLNESNDNRIKISPWFQLISNTFLFSWWKNLDDLKKIQDNVIHQL